MYKLLCLTLIFLLVGCANKKPELDPTQIVDGKSIIIPPEFDTIPESAAGDQE